MSVKRKDLMKTAGPDAARRPLAAARGKEKWGTKFRMRASLTREIIAHALLNVKINI